jgi:death-on-curing protein
MSAEEIIFLTLEEVKTLHADQLANYGGSEGFIDQRVVESAIAQPQAGMFGEYLHKDLAEMAAAYLFHLAASQGFVDGNKRTAVACADVFLNLNGYDLQCTPIELYEVTMRVANGAMGKQDIADWIRDRIEPIP